MEFSLISRLFLLIVAFVILLSGCVGTTISNNLDSDRLIINSSGSKGKDLAMMMCGGCHFDTTTQAFTGKTMSSVPWYVGSVYSANLTQDNSGVSGYQDTELERLIRFGINKEGRYIPFMGSPQISQQDLRSLITYFRSDDDFIRPSGELEKKSSLTWLAKIAFWSMQFRGKNESSSPNHNQVSNQGKYLVSILECYVCHSGSIARIDRGTPEDSYRYLRGGTLFGKYNGENVTSPALIGNSKELNSLGSLDAFTRALRYGEALNREKLRPPMPVYANLNDKEITDIYTYLVSLRDSGEGK